ncbi:MAG: type VI secretion system contractile sheath small subunit [Chitinivibrionales bacterium]|nr:type VI secretion system contractile sheath small subunit [Chitinivibrionales bacterium]MBD3358474.1 type VI secretion system contractile sheath small subunit [Chitinivibrionales bacterium]
MAGSVQKKLDRVRPPKVQINYDVETYNSVEKKELPFMMGILADLSGDNKQTDAKGRPLKITDRKFVNIDPDNFNDVLSSCKPRVTCRVPDKLSGEEGKSLNVDVEFSTLEDFHPERVAQKVEPLRKLMEARRRLASLKQKMDGNDELEDHLNDILKNADTRDKIRSSLGGDDSDSEGEPAAE